MLLKELLKSTPDKHQDYGQITASLEIIVELNFGINDTIREKQELEKILALQKQFTGFCPVR